MDGYSLDDVAAPAPAPAAAPAAKTTGYSLDDVAPATQQPIDKARPIVNNSDGSFSTERTITAEFDGRHKLIPTIVGGKQLTDDAAIAEHKAGRNPHVGDYGSAQEAETAAVARSAEIGKVRGNDAGYSLDDVAVEKPSTGFVSNAGGAAVGVRQKMQSPLDKEGMSKRPVTSSFDTTTQPDAREQPSTVMPLSAQKYRELQNLNTTDPAAIQRMAKKEGVLGDAARKIIGETAQPATMAKAVTPAPAPTTEQTLYQQRKTLTEWRTRMVEQKPEVLAYIKRASPFIDDTAAEETYTRWWSDPRKLPPEVAEDYFGRTSNLNPLQRGVATGMLNLWQGAQGSAQAISDLIGTHALSQRMREEEAGTDSTIKKLGRSPAHDGLTGALKRDFESVVGSIVQQAPALGGAMAFKAPQVAGALGMMGVQSFGQEYAEGTRSGLRPSEATARASIFASAEVIGELFGFPQYIRAMKSAMRGVPTKVLAGELAHAMTADIPGEQLTTLLEFIADKHPEFGLNPQASLQNYLQQMRDTLTQTVMQGGVMGAGSMAINAGHHLLHKDDQVGAFLKDWAQSISAAQPADADAAARAALNPDNAQVRVEEPAHHVESRKDIAALSSLLNDERPLHEIIAERTATADRLRQDQARTEQAHADTARAAADSELADLGVPPAGSNAILTWPDGAHLSGTIESAAPTSVVFKTDDGETFNVNPRDREAAFALAPQGDGTPSRPIVVEDMAHVEQAAKRIDEARSWPQIKAGNDRKAHVLWHGIPITIEVGKGDVRESSPDAPRAWSIEMPHAYGYVKGSKAADGDQSDVAIVGMHPTAHVFDTLNTETGEFDEHKTILGAGTMRAATQALKAMYDDGAKDRIGGMVAMSIPEYQTWLKSDAATSPVIFNQPAGISLDEVEDAAPTRGQQGDDLEQHSGVPSGEHVRENQTEVRQGEGEQAGDRGGLLERTAPPERTEAGDRERGGQERQGEGRPQAGNGEQRVDAAVSAEPVKPALSSETIQRIQKAHARTVEKDEQKKRGVERRKKAEQNAKGKAERTARHEEKRAKSELTRDVREQLKAPPKVENGVVVEGVTKGYLSFDLYNYPQSDRRVSLAVGGLFDEIDDDDPRFSLGARDQTDSTEFKKWFGESKVVDKDGKPLRVFHGTTSDVNSFESRRPRDVYMLDGKEIEKVDSWDMGDERNERPEGYHYGAVTDALTLGADEALKFREQEAKGTKHPDTLRHIRDLRRMVGKELTRKSEVRPTGDAFYFTPDANYPFIRDAGHYEGGNVLPAYLSIKNPVYLNASQIEGAGLSFMVEKYRKQGYDGAIYAAHPDDMKRPGWNGATQIVAFEPTQIKSATGNVGTFDPSNPDIRYSLGKPSTETDAFKDWFGSSILSVRGKPLVLYHGTQAEFDAFDIDKIGKDEAHVTSNLGFFFSPSAEFGKKYAGDSGRVLSFYLNLKRPFIMAYKDTLNIDDAAGALDMRKKLIAEGYDGIIVPKNELGFKGYVIAFEPTSIKSTDNFGTWSKTDPRFKYSRGLDDVFYSALARAIDNMPLKAASAQQWKASIKNLVQKGIKQMEIDATGINDWLDHVEYDGTPENKLAKISKENVVYYLKHNGVQVKETVLGDADQVMEIEVSDITADEPNDEFIIETARENYLDDAINEIANRDDIPLEEVDRDDAMDFATRRATDAYYDDPDYSGHASVSFMGERYQYRINVFGGDTDVWRDDGKGESIHNARGTLDKPEIEALVRADVLKITGQEDEQLSVKFDNWKLPGGKDYKELLLLLPPSENDKPATLTELPSDFEAVFEKSNRTDRQWGVSRKQTNDYKPIGFIGAAHATKEAAVNEALKLLNNERLASWAHRRDRSSFESSHFEQRNILAHVRFDTRTDADGKRVLFVEEFQSDWAQRGREEGFRSRSEPSAEEQNAATSAAREVLKANDQWGFDTVGEAMIAAANHADWADRWDVDTPEQAAIINRYRDVTLALRAARQGVSPAPFVTKTEAWVSLLMKRMIRYAAENDFDRVAWATGSQNASHYKLEKHVERIKWSPASEEVEGDINLQIDMIGSTRVGVNVGKDGKVVGTSSRHLNGEIIGKNLSDVVGQEIADKIMAEPKGELEGAGLSIGGGGMKQFYDKIVPNVTNDILKKLGGDRVIKIQMPGLTEPTVGELNRAAAQGREDVVIHHDLDNGGTISVIGKDTKTVYYTGKNYDEAVAVARKQRLPVNEQMGFDITPKLKETAIGGLPLFSRGAHFSDRYLANQAEITKRVVELAKQIAPSAHLKIVDQLFASGRSAVRSGAPTEDKVEAAGYYDALRDLITVALRYDNPAETVRHETVHHLRAAGLINDAEWAVLTKQAEAEWNGRYGVSDVEEAIAYAFGSYRGGERYGGMVARVFAKIREFLQRLANLLHGMGFQTWGDVFARLETGQIGRRGVQPAAIGETAHASIGTPADENETIKAWSVDPEEVPVGEWAGRIVFHGTSAAGAESITGEGVDISASSGGYFGRAFYVASDESLARSNYAEFSDDDDGGKVVAVRIKPDANILDMRSPDAWEEYTAVMKGHHVSDPNIDAVMRAAGVDGVFDRSFGGVAIYNPDAVEPYKFGGDKLFAIDRAQTDSAAFKKWFGDSKVVDAQGKPLVVYHGTDSADVTLFDGRESVGWFSEEPYIASEYAAQRRSGNEENELESTPNVMPVYLSIKNPLELPFDMNDAAEAAHDVAGEIGMTKHDIGGESRAWEIVNNWKFSERARQSGYDGIRIRERGLWTWSPFDTKQAKSAVGNRGTFDARNPDIRYSTGDDSDLIIQHNVTAANVMHADRMGGLAVPSLAITKADDAMINFGEITLIGDRNMADPRGYARTHVFGADIYSPRYPTVHYKFTQNNVNNMKRMLAPAIAATHGIEWDEVQKRGAAQFENEPAIMWQYLTDRGIVPNVVMEKGITKKRVAELKRAGLEKYFGRTDWQSLAHDEEFAKLVHADIQREYERAGATDLMTPWEKTTSSQQVNGSIQHAQAMGKIGAPEKVNPWATRDALRAQVRKLPDGDLAFYAQEWFAKLAADEKLFKGHNYNGNATYKPHTLDNVVRELKKSIRGGEGFNYGLGSARSKVTPEFKSIKEIKAQSGRIVPKEKIEEFKKVWDAQLHEIWNDAAEYHHSGQDFGFGDTLIDSLAESASRGLERALKDNAFDVERMPQELKDRMNEFVDEMREWPTEYFEAKILRSVDLAEFKAAVVPKGTNQRVIDLLESKGLHVATYNPKTNNGDMSDRKRVIDNVTAKLGIRFSLGEQENAAEDANTALTNRPTGTMEFEREPSPFGAGKLADDVSWLQRFAVHPRTIATMNQHFAPVYLAAVHQFEHRDEIAAGLQRDAQPYFDLPRDSKERVNAILELGRLTGTVYGTGTTPVSVTNDTGRADALLGAGETLTLTDREKAGYWAIRRSMDSALVMFKEQVIREWGLDPTQVHNAREIMDAVPAGATTAEADRYATVAMLVREIDEARKKGYIPFNRQGQVGILVRERGVVDDWEVGGEEGERPRSATKHFEMVEVDGLLQRAARALKLTSSEMAKMGAVKERVDTLKTLYPEHDISVFQVSPNAPIAGDVKMSDLDMLASVAQIDEGAWVQVRSGLQDALQKRGFRKHFFGSQNVPGYSQDFERSIADYIVGISGYLSRRQASPKWDEAIGNIPTEKPWLMKYAQNYRDYVNNPVEEFAGLRQAGFFYYLAGVPSTAIINATQVGMITAPFLTQFANSARVAAELTVAYKDAATMLRFGSDVFNPESAPDDIRAEFQQAWDEGFFVPVTTYEMMGLAHNRMPALRHMAKRARQTLDTVSYLFNAAERTNRVVTFIASVRLAKATGFSAKVSRVLAGNMLARADLMREFTPAKFAEFVIDETHFRMGKVNRPQAMRGVGAALLQFKGFTFQAVELYGRLASQNGAQGKMAFALMMMMLMMTSGLWGLPFGKNFADLMEFLYKRYTDTDIDLKTKMREFVYNLTASPRLARAFTDGALSQTIGVDVGQRIGQGTVLPESASDIGGIPLSMTIGKAGQALDYAQRGQGMLAMAEIMPNFIKNPLTAYAWSEEGVKSQSTGKVFLAPEHVTTADKAKKAIGFTPFGLANIREAEYAVKRAEHEVDALRSDYYAKLATVYAKAQRADDAGRTKEALEFEIAADKLYSEIEKFNTGRADHEQVRIDPKALQNRVREELYGFEQRKGKEKKQARDRAEEIRQIYGTEVAGQK